MPEKFESLNKINEMLSVLGEVPKGREKVVATLDIAREILNHFGDLPVMKSEDIADEVLELPRQNLYDSWFLEHPVFESQSACYEIPLAEESIVQPKLYCLKKRSRLVVSGAVAFSPNWEDEDYTRNVSHKVGIDFYLSPEQDSVIVALSDRGNVRVVELEEHITNTQFEIFKQWEGLAREIDRAALHAKLWKSFELKSVNKLFYLEVANYFDNLVAHLEDKGKDEEDAKLFASRLIGRLLFCWFLRKKEIISKKYEYFEIGHLNSTEYYRSKLVRLFFDTLNKPIDSRKSTSDVTGNLAGKDDETPYLNGGLFEIHRNDWYQDESLTFPPDFFRDLYDHFNQFNFTTDESSAEYEQVAIDPEMLGQIFESLLATQSDETGKQARKAKGSFYTPRVIVSYMCKESVRQYLYSRFSENSSIKEQVDRLLDKSDKDWAINKDNWRRDMTSPMRREILGALDELKSIDPACGSGAFPMGMVQLLVQLYERLESRFDVEKTKLGILENNIYGVDIEPMAVEIARLRSWLTLVVEANDRSEIKPLPNLDFKFVCANSLFKLVELGQGNFFNDDSLHEDLKAIIAKYFAESNPKIKTELRKKYEQIAEQAIETSSNERTTQLVSFRPFENTEPAEFFDSDQMFTVKNGFDVVIGNPPYVGTKGRTDLDKKSLKQEYGFADDLYSHFIFRGIELLKDGGILSYITSKTFWTIQSKQNLREHILNYRVCSIFDSANPFEAAMVDTSVLIIQKSKSNRDHELEFFDGTQDLGSPIKFGIKQSLYNDAVNNVIFPPTEENLKVYEKYNAQVSSLMKEWWPRIYTSKEIARNETRLNQYRKELNPGDLTLLGLITEGGQGLATSNNGKYVGVLEGTKEAARIKETRIEKFFEYIQKFKISKYGSTKTHTADYLSKLDEKETRVLFDSLKEEYGRDIFGQGYLFRVVNHDEVKNVAKMTEVEKWDGIKTGSSFVPYDKGDKDGNSWYLRTPYYIDWSYENVQFMKSNSGKKGKGMPVVRNPQFNFRSGFCWNFALLPTQEESKIIKCRYKDPTVNDVMTMALFPLEESLTKYIVAVLNARYFYNYLKTFINSTAGQQINDFRQIPIIVPSKTQLEDFENIFDRAYQIKIEQFDETITLEIAKKQLAEIQTELDQKVEELYGL